VAQGPTIGVVSTSFGGVYFGGLLGAIAATVAKADGRLVAIQTLDAGTFAVDLKEPPDFVHKIAWDHVDGVIVLLNAVTTDYLRTYRETGRPVVIISDSPPGFACPIVLPDNRGGAQQATRHLIEHGHRRIAFVGALRQQDVQERFDGYRQTLLEFGITPDPKLFFSADGMQQSDGEVAGRAMLAAGLPSTAVVTGNDLNAVGLIRSLTAAGLDVPTDQAVIGFDDTEVGAYLTPGLTSVRQNVEDIGGRAAELAIRMIGKEDVATGYHQVATSLTVRESCGCFSNMSAGTSVEVDSTPQTEVELFDRICAILRTRVSEDQQRRRLPDIEAGVGIVATVLAAAVTGQPGPTGLELRRTLTPLGDMLDSSESLSAMTQYVRQYSRHLLVASNQDRNVDVIQRVETCLQQVYMMLAHAQISERVSQGESMMASMGIQYLVSMNLLRSQERAPRSLDWLRVTGIRGGCLGLWPTRESGVQDQSGLNVVRTFDAQVGSYEEANPYLGISAFPPAHVLEMADLAADDMVYIAHLKVDSGDWGMLALVGPVQGDLKAGRETMNQWGAMLSVALEYEAVLETLREQEEHLRRAALYDELTGLPNRAFFRERLTMAMARTARRPGYRYAVLLLDLDGFKNVNDSLGHLVGDRLLSQVASRISMDLRVIDTAARFGGDEFAILLEEIQDVSAAAVLAERLQTSLSAPYDLGGEEVVVSASIGIAFGDEEYDDTEDVVRNADVAMYSAKARGKGTHAVFEPSMHASAVHRLRIEGELRRALENDELQLYYQPIVNLKTGLANGAEALIRWQHPTRGLLAPGEFLPVAEESGLMLPIGNWVLDEACRQMKAWKLDEEDAPHFVLSVNVSNRQFWRSRLIDGVDQRLKLWGLDPGRLAVEITEGVIMHDVKLASEMLNGLHTMGVQVHVDDFGTGYSSLEALHDLSIDALKIDRSFVSRLTTSARSRELVRTIVTMGLNLNLDVIAEGIETPFELDYVRELGCTHGQGYFFSRAVPADLALTYIGRQLPPT
jgi:diguanylate cyclase (GGDEF)-like protein